MKMRERRLAEERGKAGVAVFNEKIKDVVEGIGDVIEDIGDAIEENNVIDIVNGNINKNENNNGEAIAEDGPNNHNNNDVSNSRCSRRNRNSNNIIKGMILDSPFASLTILCEELVERKGEHGVVVPGVVVSVAIAMISRSVRQLADFNIRDITPIDSVPMIDDIPALFMFGSYDDFIPPHHSEKLIVAYTQGITTNLFMVPGGHNDARPRIAEIDENHDPSESTVDLQSNDTFPGNQSGRTHRVAAAADDDGGGWLPSRIPSDATRTAKESEPKRRDGCSKCNDNSNNDGNLCRR